MKKLHEPVGRVLFVNLRVLTYAKLDEHRFEISVFLYSLLKKLLSPRPRPSTLSFFLDQPKAPP